MSPIKVTAAAIYVRQSLDKDGRQLAVDRQEAACRALAERLGWPVVAVHRDNSVSASRGKRPGFETLLGALHGRAVDAVIAWHPDRLARRPDDLERLILAVEQRRARVATVEAGEYDLGSPSGRAVARTVVAWARAEVEHKGARQVASNVQRASSGQMPWTRRPYGYDLDTAGKIVAVKGEARILKAAAKEVLAGSSLSATVRALNDAGERTTLGNPWTVTTLRRCLLNPRLSGQVTYKGERTSIGLWKAILDAETQQALAAVLRDPSRRTQVSTTRKHPFSGALLCGACDEPSPVYAAPIRGRGYTYPGYRCRRPHLTRKQDLVDEVIVDVLVGRLSADDAADLVVTSENVDDLKLEAADLQGRLDGLASLVADGSLSPDAVREQSGKLRPRLQALQHQIQSASADSVAARLVGADDVRAAWDDLSVNDKRAVLDELVVVTLLPAGKGARFDPSLVHIEWRQA